VFVLSPARAGNRGLPDRHTPSRAYAQLDDHFLIVAIVADLFRLTGTASAAAGRNNSVCSALARSGAEVALQRDIAYSREEHPCSNL